MIIHLVCALNYINNYNIVLNTFLQHAQLIFLLVGGQIIVSKHSYFTQYTYQNIMNLTVRTYKYFIFQSLLTALWVMNETYCAVVGLVEFV